MSEPIVIADEFELGEFLPSEKSRETLEILQIPEENLCIASLREGFFTSLEKCNIEIENAGIKIIKLGPGGSCELKNLLVFMDEMNIRFAHPDLLVMLADANPEIFRKKPMMTLWPTSERMMHSLSFRYINPDLTNSKQFWPSLLPTSIDTWQWILVCDGVNNY